MFLIFNLTCNKFGNLDKLVEVRLFEVENFLNNDYLDKHAVCEKFFHNCNDMLSLK